MVTIHSAYYSSQSAIKRRDILQLTQEKMAEDREKRKKAHDEVGGR